MKAVILAGGKSSRMGQNKALMKLGEKTIIEYVMESFSSVFDEVFISGNRNLNAHFSNKIIEDSTFQKGPIGGIFSSLEYLKGDIFVCSCDMPFVSSELIENIIQKKENNSINIARFGDKIYPVLGIYPLSILEDLKKAIETGKLRMTNFLQEQNANYIQFDEEFKHQFLNINTPDNFRTAELILNLK